jgi:hypothetical protein
MSLFAKKNLKSSLAITTHAGCRNQCTYCPQRSFIESYRKRSDEYSLSPDTFRRCIQTVPESICISFSGFCEPWMNPGCTQMILYAHEKGHQVRVNTTLVGIKPGDIEVLKNIPFIKFVVHLPDNKGLTKINPDEEYLAVLSMMLKVRLNNLKWKFHSTDPDIRIHPDVNRLLIHSGVRISYADLNNRAGNVRTIKSYQPVNKGRVLLECQDFHHNILLPNGDVVLCHMDWSLKHVLGNLLTDNYIDLYSGEAFQEINTALQDPDADILCRDCEKDLVKRTIPDRIIHVLSKKIKGGKDIY